MLQFIHTMGYYAVTLTKNQVQMQATTWVNFKPIRWKKELHTQEYILHGLYEVLEQANLICGRRKVNATVAS